MCNFEFGVSDLQPLSEEQVKQKVGRRSLFIPLRPTISNAIWVDDGSTCFVLDHRDQELFNRFRSRTLYSLHGAAMVEIYENHMLAKSFTVSRGMVTWMPSAACQGHSKFVGTCSDACETVSIPDAWHISGCSCPRSLSLLRSIPSSLFTGVLSCGPMHNAFQ